MILSIKNCKFTYFVGVMPICILVQKFFSLLSFKTETLNKYKSSSDSVQKITPSIFLQNYFPLKFFTSQIFLTRYFSPKNVRTQNLLPEFFALEIFFHKHFASQNSLFQNNYSRKCSLTFVQSKFAPITFAPKIRSQSICSSLKLFFKILLLKFS